jgi:ribonuclease P protein component
VLPSNERLSRKSLFQRAYDGRKSISSPLVTLYVVPRTKQAGARAVGAVLKHSENGAEMPLKSRSVARMPLVGFVVAKKVCKSACARNRAKRRLREAYRLLRQSRQAEPLALSQWYALVWVVHEKALQADWEEIKRTVSECLTRANARFKGMAADRNPASGGRATDVRPDRDKQNPQGKRALAERAASSDSSRPKPATRPAVSPKVAAAGSPDINKEKPSASPPVDKPTSEAKPQAKPKDGGDCKLS